MTIKNKEQWDKFVTRSKTKGLKIYAKHKRRSMAKGLDNIHRRNSLYLAEQKYKNITGSEIRFGYILCENGIEFMYQKGFFSPFHRIADFYIPNKKLIIEIDGGYHKEPYYQEKDRMKDVAFLKNRGIKTVRLLNEQVDTYMQPMKQPFVDETTTRKAKKHYREIKESEEFWMKNL